MDSFYNKSPEEIFEQYSSSKEGLSSQMAAVNRGRFGENKLQEKHKKSVLSILIDQFKDLLVLILLIAAIISAATGSVESTVVIIAVLILNAILGTVQTVKAEQSLESLKNLSSPTAKVLRDGRQQVIPAADLVCGDVVSLEAGDIVPGDGRIFDNFSLKVNESALTGESESVDKTSHLINKEDVALGDQENMVFSGSLVTYGRATMVTTGVGRNTELGRIADLMSETGERQTPLQVTMDNFSKKLSIGILVICVLVLSLSLYRGMDLLDALLFAVALAVAAIPEALSSIITISLAIGTSRMTGENAIIKKLEAVEGLGCVSIICSDKTGTLTQNKMTVEHVSPWNGADKDLSLASILCNDTSFADGHTVGDPTETALVEFYINHTDMDDYNKVIEDHPRKSEVPFDSDRKLMSTMQDIDGQHVMYTKGALDVILARSSNLTEEDKEKIAQENFDLSNSGLRVLAFAKRLFPDSVMINTEHEYDMEYIGLMAEMDPPREESAQAVEDCEKAGIKPIMITGDHKITASAIARRIGIMKEGDMAITGPELDKMSEDDLMRDLEKISVYARVSPDNKIRIVHAWQDKGNIVAMTGDGVNDGPALKSADVGVAMGITGTEVAKDSASMILTDDNFATIIKSVLNGRNIYNNIKNAIKFLLSGNMAGIFVVMIASLFGLPMPFTAVQLLFINLITDSLPALAISMEPSDPSLINEKPRPRDESVLTPRTMRDIVVWGGLIASVTMLAFLIGLEIIPLPLPGYTEVASSVGNPGVVGSTMAFTTLCLARLFHGFNCRGNGSIRRLGLTSNKYSIGAFCLGAALLMFLVLTSWVDHVFGIGHLQLIMVVTAWVLSFIPTLIIQLFKIHKEKTQTN